MLEDRIARDTGFLRASEERCSFLRDLVVEECTQREVTVLCDAPAAGSDLILDLIGSGPCSTFRVRVSESTRVVVDGSMRYRLRLAIVG